MYPCIESKLMQIDRNIDVSELYLPFSAIEIRTSNKTFLACNHNSGFYFVVDITPTIHQEFLIHKLQNLSATVSAPYREIKQDWPRADEKHDLQQSDRIDIMLLVAGICMLAKDKSIVQPVILNKHRKDGMTPAEIAEYAAKAVARTGRVGFEVGREIERQKATVHYRNGCFAKYYVGKAHECYPTNAEADKVPIIKWRCGSVVNKDNVPKVPTGFKDLQPQPAN